MVVNQEDGWFLNNITNSVLAQAQRVNSIFERGENQEMNNQEMNTMTSNNQSNEERTIEDLPPSYRSILRPENRSTANTTFERQLMREIKEIKLRIIDIFRICNRCEANCHITLSFCIIISITFLFFYLIYVYSSTPVSWSTNSTNLEKKNFFDNLEEKIFNN